MHTSRRNFVAIAIIGALGLCSGMTLAEGSETESQRLVRTHATERYNVVVPGFSIRATGGRTEPRCNAVARHVDAAGHWRFARASVAPHVATLTRRSRRGSPLAWGARVGGWFEEPSGSFGSSRSVATTRPSRARRAAA